MEGVKTRRREALAKILLADWNGLSGTKTMNQEGAAGDLKVIFVEGRLQ